ALEISVVGAKHRTSWRHGIFTRLVARGCRPILPRASFALTCPVSPPARVRDHCLHHHFRRNRSSHDPGVSESHRDGSFLSRFPGLDLLSNLDPARSACAWCCSCRDRKIQTKLVARPDKPCAVDLVPRARADQLRALVGRRRTPHNCCLRLAISIGCSWYGGVAHLRCKSTT